jgi:GDP-L-fucose synthase
MDKHSRIFVAGHRGLAGSAILRHLHEQGFSRVLVRSHSELDLADRSAVWDFFRQEQPEYVFLAAAKVGGIMANSLYPLDFIRDNLKIQTNVIEASQAFGISRLLFLGSSCIYPRECPQPIREEYLMTGPLEPTNRPYAIAKIAGVELCWAGNRQLRTRYMCAMPTNLYGPNDNYELETSHVLPALIRKMHEAKSAGEREVVLWGTGTPFREFLYSDDLAEACLFLMTLPEDRLTSVLSGTEPPLINIGTGQEVSISALAELVAQTVGFEGVFLFDSTKPDGTPRKLLDVSRINSLGWTFRTSLRSGIQKAYHDFLQRHDPKSLVASNC